MLDLRSCPLGNLKMTRGVGVLEYDKRKGDRILEDDEVQAYRDLEYLLVG